MPVNTHVLDSGRKRFKVNDSVILRLPKFVKDADDTTIYPQEVLKAFIKYFNNLYHAKTAYAERFIVDRKPSENDPGKSHIDLFLYVPGELSREDFLDDLEDFTMDFPGVSAEIIKRWPKANEWNEAHKEEIESGAVKPRQEGIKMAKNATSAFPKRTFKTLLAWIMEEEPVNPYPDATPEQLEELEAKKDPKLMEFYKKEDDYDAHQAEVKPLLNTFEQAYGTKFNKEDEDDIEGLELVYNDEYDKAIEEERKWYPADVRLHFNVGEFAPGKVGNVDLLSLYDKKPEKKETKDSKTVKDEEDPRLKVCQLLGEAHDKIMEALDLVEDLENEDKVPSTLRYALEDLEASASEFDFMGENKPVDILMGTYPLDEDEDYDGEDEEEDFDEEDW